MDQSLIDDLKARDRERWLSILWAPAEAPCPKCRGPRYVALKALGEAESPVCFDCGSGFA